MNNRAFYTIMFLSFFGVFRLYGQFEIKGIIQDAVTDQVLANVEIFCQQTEKVVYSSEDGSFSLLINNGENNDYIFYHNNYAVWTESFCVQNINQKEELTILLHPLNVTLSTVEITARRKELFAMRKMRDVEGTTIHAGKKTEVVILDKISGNLANNQSRQIYAQVAGLNIYEGSDGGLQLSIGGRGLDPNRTSNFNTRQNGYDISADVLGYPESYYTPPAHGIREIQIIRGASSLQYGTQFGGLINFKLDKLPTYQKLGVKASATTGSFGLFDGYMSIGKNTGKLSVNMYYNFKRGDGYRSHSEFNVHNFFGLVEYRPSRNITVSGEMTYYTYLAKQAGGLTDQQFQENPRQSTRERNWFEVDWQLYSLKYQHRLSERSKLHINLFGLNAGRKSLGFRGNPTNLNENPITALDEKDVNGNYVNPRDLILGNFKNYGAEMRFLTNYSISGRKSVFLSGAKWYHADNSSIQGPGSTGVDANFELKTSLFPDYPSQSNFHFPNKNLAFFGENIFYLTERFSLTPGFRFEFINTGAQGIYNQVVFDNAGNPIANNELTENKDLKRSFLIMGLGAEFKKNRSFEVFANLSQNYRSITFSDIRIVSPTFIVDPDLSDEKGFTSDVGVRGRKGKKISYNVGVFSVWYQDRIGIILNERANRVRTNIGNAFICGFESLLDFNLKEIFEKNKSDFGYSIYSNFAYTYSRYFSSRSQNVAGKKVEFIPTINLKAGVKLSYKTLQTSLQFSYLSKQFTDAQNSPVAQQGDLRSGVIGEIPAYSVTDLSVSLPVKSFKLSAGINNVFNTSYFTRRATGYPGPGIIPSDGRSWFLGIAYKL